MSLKQKFSELVSAVYAVCIALVSIFPDFISVQYYIIDAAVIESFSSFEIRNAHQVN